MVAVELPGADIPLEDDLAEALELTRATGGQVVGTLTCRRGQVDPALFIGSGKAAELAELVAATQADLVILNQALSPSQERNLERLLKCQVLDRIGLKDQALTKAKETQHEQALWGLLADACLEDPEPVETDFDPNNQDPSGLPPACAELERRIEALEAINDDVETRINSVEADGDQYEADGDALELAADTVRRAGTAGGGGRPFLATDDTEGDGWV